MSKNAENVFKFDYINIKNFKCFNNFEFNSFKKINLISGKNNRGKTIFMEACYISANSNNVSNFIGSLVSIKFMRENINVLAKKTNNYHKGFLENTKKLDITSNLNTNAFEIIDKKDGLTEYSFKVGKINKKINSKFLSFESDMHNNINFIDNFGWSDNEIIHAYQFIQLQDKEKDLDKLINSFDERISSFKVIEDSPVCKIDDEYVSLTEFGDGLKHYISIICALYASKNGVLFIDEIDNGIHYTQLKYLWEIIFKISNYCNCQVFATTHSKECIESFNSQNTEDEGQFIEFFLNKKNLNKVDYIIRNSEQLKFALDGNERIRGE